MKSKTVYICSACAYNSPKWEGKCPNCGEWNSFSEQLIHKKQKVSSGVNKQIQAVTIDDIDTRETPRVDSQDPELNRVLGGGMVPGSVILLAGEPGIGKSTLSLQLAANKSQRILYVSGEESAQQLKMRADRLQVDNPQCYIIDDTDMTAVLDAAKKILPDLLIVDSIQTMRLDMLESAPGTVSQIRECASLLQRYAKEHNRTVIIIGHINKEGAIAGPKVLEHIVDVVLHFEGLKHNNYRMIRGIKNRFGASNEIGVYEMRNQGLVTVENPSALLINVENQGLSGNTIGVLTEGMRPLMIECQALVTRAVYGTPQRSATGYDAKRLNMLLAVLEKRCGLPFGTCDVFLNIVGGIKVNDPGLDLAILAALISSLNDIPVSKDVCLFGEVGLSGEIRPVQKADARVEEAERLGFEEILLSHKNVPSDSFAVKLRALKTVEDLISEIFS